MQWLRIVPLFKCYLLCALFMPLSGNAQTQAAGNVSVSASVSNVFSIEILTLQELNFTIDNLDETTFYIPAITSQNAALLELSGVPNAEFIINFPESEIRQHETLPSAELIIVYELSGYFERFQGLSLIIQSAAVPLRFGPEGKFFVWIGGTISFPAGAAPGRYAGAFDLEIEYVL